MLIDKEALEKILGRKEYDLDISASGYENKKVLITGAAGSIGRSVSDWLRANNVTFIETDIDDLDVTLKHRVFDFVNKYNPDIIFHLAGQKHAPVGEDLVTETVEINYFGTQNILNAIRDTNAKAVVASTCKAINPETVYGATKLLCERMILNHGSNVARFFNVVETSGNVFELWNQASKIGNSIDVTPCKRFFISLKEATMLTLFAGVADHGRYCIEPGEKRNMIDVARELYPSKTLITVPPRRGDRIEEPFCGTSEVPLMTTVEHIVKVVSHNDAR